MKREQGLDISIKMADQMLSLGAVKAATVAGSIRRGKPEVKDAEIVVDPTEKFRAVTDAMLNIAGISKARYGNGNMTRWGEKYRGLEVAGFKVELFCATAANWGYILWLRTGPGDANQLAMLHMARKTQIRAIDGYLWGADEWTPVRKSSGIEWRSPDKQRLRVETELAMFALLGIRMMPPGERDEVAYQVAFQTARPSDWREYIDRVAETPKQMELF